MHSTNIIDALSNATASLHVGSPDLTSALVRARNALADLYVTAIAVKDDDSQLILDLALDCLDFAVDYSREEPTADVHTQFTECMGDVIHTLRNSLLRL